MYFNFRYCVKNLNLNNLHSLTPSGNMICFMTIKNYKDFRYVLKNNINKQQQEDDIKKAVEKKENFFIKIVRFKNKVSLVQNEIKLDEKEEKVLK